MHTFKNYHPVVNFIYFVSVIFFSMFLMHPICLAISLGCSFIYSVKLKGKKALFFNITYMLPLLIVTALVNPAFNHEGATILGYFKSGNPLTLESIVYGIAAAAMMASVICWFSCYNEVMTNDKFIYLFGRLIPSLSLILSMVLRFIPKFKTQIKSIAYSQEGIGRGADKGNLLHRARCGMRILSIMITWAFEDAIQTADSMKSRGYGLPGRTAFSIYHFTKRDIGTLVSILAMASYILMGIILNKLHFRYFPKLQSLRGLDRPLSYLIIYFCLCMTPIIIEFWEEYRWNVTKSRT